MDPFRDKYRGTPYHQNLASDAIPDRFRMVLDCIGPNRLVLEVGCHTGYFSALLQERGCSVVGVEKNTDAAAQARAVVDQMITGDIEDATLWSRIPTSFDVVLFMDVLEHLVDPWSVLRQAREHVGPHGRVVASLPNVACWSIRRELLCGRFVSAKTGLQDPSHLRFFTLNDAIQLFADSGFSVTSCHPLWTSVPLMHRFGRWPRLANWWRDRWVARYPNLAIAVPLIEAQPR